MAKVRASMAFFYEPDDTHKIHSSKSTIQQLDRTVYEALDKINSTAVWVPGPSVCHSFNVNVSLLTRFLTGLG